MLGLVAAGARLLPRARNGGSGPKTDHTNSRKAWCEGVCAFGALLEKNPRSENTSKSSPKASNDSPISLPSTESAAADGSFQIP